MIDRTELIQLLTRIETGKTTEEDLNKIYKNPKREIRIGVTGMPGAGKSCLIDKLLFCLRKDRKRVGVLALDPVSPISGGSIMADRVRMQQHAVDENIFIRSLENRNLHGNTDASVSLASRALASAGFDLILIESVGVGQAELSIADFVDILLVVLPSDFGDKLQSIKSGILEIADIIIVNKSDLPAANQVFEILKATRQNNGNLISVSAKNNENISRLYKMINDSIERFTSSGILEERRRERCGKELLLIIHTYLEEKLVKPLSNSPEFKEGVDKILKNDVIPMEIARSLLKLIPEFEKK